MRGWAWKVRARLFGSGIARNVNGGSHERRALLLARVGAFRLTGIDRAHQNIGQFRALARELGSRGYQVDVIDFDERNARLLSTGYDLVIDLHPADPPVYREHLRPGARTVSYITGGNPCVANAAEQGRIDALERRRGVRLAPRRQTPPFPPRFEAYDAMLTFANEWSLSTYSNFRLPPVRHLVNPGWEVPATEPAGRDPRRFLFLASTGQVHKGLDRLLEVFASEPELSLTVCSPYARELDFTRAYRRELFDTPNIRAVGFVNVGAPEFRELQATCGAMVLPTCSEAQCGSVTVAMSFGLPILASREADFPAEEVTLLPDCEIETIRAALREWAALPAEEIAARARRTSEIVRERYRPSHYEESLRAALEGLA